MSVRSAAWRAMLASSCLLAVSLSGCGGGGGGGTRYYEDFTAQWEAGTHTMSAAQCAEPRDVQGTYVRLSSFSVQWDSMNHTLSGPVEIENIHSQTLSSVQAQIISYDPSNQSITDNGPCSYSDIPPGYGWSRWWIVTDPNDVSFAFTVRVSWSW